MTETLQDKIDAIFKHYAQQSEYATMNQVNKAIQELREEINNEFDLQAKREGNDYQRQYFIGYCNALNFILALIGEKK